MKASVISYPGESTIKIIQNILKYLNNINDDIKYIICLFPNFERFVFYKNGINSACFNFQNMSSKFEINKTNFDEILPVEWIYYINMEYIKILETICKIKNIQLFWSTWSDWNPDTNFLLNNFNNFVADESQNIFGSGPMAIWNKDTNKIINKYYKPMSDKCNNHSIKDYPEKYFYCAADTGPVLIDSKLYCLPHHGIHRHIHWAEMFYDKIVNIEE